MDNGSSMNWVESTFLVRVGSVVDKGILHPDYDAIKGGGDSSSQMAYKFKAL